MSSRRVTAKAVNSCPSVIGTASWSWVRPTLTMCANSPPLAANASASRLSSLVSDVSEKASAIFTAVGYVSFVDWLRFVWSLGLRCSYAPFSHPPSSSARFVTTSLTFMFVEVPAPPWTTPTVNSSRSRPALISSHAASMRPERSASRAPISRFARAAACLTQAKARTNSG